MKLKFIYSTLFCMLLCLTAHQIRAQITTTFSTDSTWSGNSTPGRNLSPLPYSTIFAGPWAPVVINQSVLDFCLDSPLTYPGTPIFSPGNDVCYDGGIAGVLTSYFRRDFTLNGGNNPLCSATIRVRADNLFRVYVDGNLVTAPDRQACNGWNYLNLSGWNFLTVYTVNIMPFINLSLTTHTILVEVGNCDYINYLAATVTIEQGLPYYSADFDVDINCNNGWSVTATPDAPAASNHVWELYQTTVPGATTGGTLVATQTSTTANFQWLDLSKYYYIIHRIQVGCNQVVEVAHEVPHFTNATLTYNFEDANGVVKNQFCVGEDVFLDPTGTTNYDRYLMIIRSRPIGGGAFGNDFNYGYTFTDNIGLLNLTDLFETAGYVFAPGMEYELQFVIQNIPNCIAWVELKKTFTIVCCPTTPDFTIAINCTNGWGATATPNSPTITNHVWQLFQTTVPGATTGGVQVGPDQFGPTVNYQWLDQSAFYYIRHSIFMNGCYSTLTSSVAVPTFASQANASYTLEDENGVVKNVFCVGEDIYLDGTASSNYDRFFLAVWRRPITGGTFTYYANYGWTPTGNIGIRNLSQMFLTGGDNPGEVFEPGFEYQLQFAIANPPNCIPWIELTQTFTVECCEDFISADFKMNLLEGEEGFSIEVSDFKTYGVNATHSWTILSSPNPNDGPYNLVLETTTSGAGPHTLYSAGESGLFYFVIHTVSTLCGDFCYLKRGELFGAQAGGEPGSEPDGGTPCELCGEIDCDFLNEICFVPNNLQIRCNPFLGLIASWDPVPGAIEYRLELTFNDPNCCNTPANPYVYTFTTTNTFQIMGNLQNSCFSYRIAAICAREPQWSEPLCFTGCNVDSGAGIRLAENNNTEVTAATPGQVQIFPNPANDEINLILSLEAKANLVRITNLQGKVVFEQRNPEQHLKIDSSKFIAGMYAIQIIYPDGSHSVEQIVITH